MRPTSSTIASSILALWIAPSWQQAQDPLQDFCRRFGHQTAVIDDRIYIDGGLINFNPLSQNPLNYSNTNLLYADVTVSNGGMPQEFNNLTKPGTVPSVSGGILWPDTVNKKFYLYGGDFQINPQAFSMWSYDDIYGNWTSLVPDASQSSIVRSSWGAGIADQERGVGYWYGGWVSNESIPTWNAPSEMLSTFLMYDMVENSWTNSSGPDDIGRAEGIMTYIPAGDGGMLLYMGGIQTSTANEDGFVGQPMNEILIYDVANSKWYTQNATGDVPDMRRRFCGGAAWAEDYSSYNIYLYGGASMPPSTIGFDDVYILSVPSFQWIKWYPTQATTPSPHHSFTCNVINGNQMLILGGSFPNSTSCDSAATYGFHNLDLTEENAVNAKWVAFNDSKTGYTVPPEIVQVVGGGPGGAATKKTPAAGFDNVDLSILFTRVFSAATTRTPTRAIPTATGASSSSHSLSTGSVIGIAVGCGVAAVLLLVGLVCFCLHRRRTRRGGQGPSTGKPTELPGSSQFSNSPNMNGSQPYSPHNPNFPSHSGYGSSYGYSPGGNPSPGAMYPPQQAIYQLPAEDNQYLGPPPVIHPVELSARELGGMKTPATEMSTVNEKADPRLAAIYGAGAGTGMVSYQHTPSPTSGVVYSTSPPQASPGSGYSGGRRSGSGGGGYFSASGSPPAGSPTSAIFVQPEHLRQQARVYYPPPTGSSGARSPVDDRYTGRTPT